MANDRVQSLHKDIDEVLSWSLTLHVFNTLCCARKVLPALKIASISIALEEGLSGNSAVSLC